MTPTSLTDIVKAYDVRGTVPDQLDTRVTRALGAAFAEVVVRGEHTSDATSEITGTDAPQPTGDPASRPAHATQPTGQTATGCVVGHDMRDSSPELVGAFADGARSRGVDVTLIGLASTDALYYASGALDLPGAMFTASHNPAAYNGIKLCRAGARPVGQDTGLADVRALAERILDGDVPDPGGPSGELTHRDVLPDYAAFLRGLVDLSGGRPLTVVVDAGNGMGGHTVPAVLGTEAGLPELPLTIVPLYFELDGTFPNHEANPLKEENLLDLMRAVRESEADLGVASGNGKGQIFVKGEVIRTVPESKIVETLIDEAMKIAEQMERSIEPMPLAASTTTLSGWP